MKLYDICIDPNDIETGMSCISLVEFPAVEVDFLAFSKEEPKTFDFADDEKHIITGVAILADTPIYRIAPDGTEYYVRFTKDCIRQLVEKYFKFGMVNNVNLDHNPMTFAEGVTMIESYIIDKERGICPNEFTDVPDGSWIVSYRCNNVDLWDKIKSKEVKGFSIELNSFLKPVENETKLENNKHSFMSKLKEKIKALLMQFATVKTDKGDLVYNTETLEVGAEVFVEDENGENVPAADGEYVLEDGRTVVVAEGKVTEIKEKAEEPKTDPEEPKNDPEEPKTDPEEPEEPKTDPEEPKNDPEEPKTDPALEERIAALEAKIAELEAKLAEIVTTPAVPPIEEEFSKTPKADPKNKMAAVAAAYRASKERK